MKAKIGETGLAIVDSLQGLQLIAQGIEDPEDKFTKVKSAITTMGALSLREAPLFVSTSEMWIKEQDVYRRYAHSFMFRSILQSIAYMYDPDIPVDSLALRFESPDVISVDASEVSRFEGRLVSIPVLAIDACKLAA